ncbi:penicillin binding protein transpeptidase domain-containing protein [Nocardiopsis lambiniae]|uniref:Penicillin binding protein transpeptidase domain-containing protein n=1 Tax=Nocardiopsis lambiniae TaxID=3075539 RepID=A0ABU2MGW3_9ACTN|nr:penicillin binding protein transpeptidase domain-containing protein [Nocardiopsis sp. DSM 44743]MDT0331086.1 penicillin binding protein transpeptidase domain-containing protein [Nocardiopsis sp. DSM 44743]
MRRTRRIGCASVVGATVVTLLGCSAPREEDPPDSGEGRAAAVVGGDVAASERADLADVFAAAEVTGTFVLYDTQERRSVLVEPERARERAVPGDTFDLVIALTALQTGAITDPGEVVDAGGPAPRDAVDRVGHGPMATWVDRFEYGGRDIGGTEDVEAFWSRGPLGISAVEQTEFLAGLARGELPVDAEHQSALREEVLVERGRGYALYGRSSCDDGTDAPGWWVGWVTGEAGVHTFALRLEADEGFEPDSCETLGRGLLTALEVLPEGAGPR